MRQIRNYHELVVEKQQAQQRLALLKRDIEGEVSEIKERFRPITRIVSMISGNGNGNGSKIGSNGQKDSLLKMGANLGVDLLVGPKLAKAGWIARLLVPPLLRGISSTVINRFKKKK